MNLTIEQNVLSLSSVNDNYLDLKLIKKPDTINSILIHNSQLIELDLRDFHNLKYIFIDKSFIKNILTSPLAQVEKIYVLQSIIDSFDVPNVSKECECLAIFSSVATLNDRGLIKDVNVTSLLTNINADKQDNLEFYKQIILVNENKKTDLTMDLNDWWFPEYKAVLAIGSEIDATQAEILVNRYSDSVERLYIVGLELPKLDFSLFSNLKEVLLFESNSEDVTVDITSHNLKEFLMVKSNLAKVKLNFYDKSQTLLLLDKYIMEKCQIKNCVNTKLITVAPEVDITEFTIPSLNDEGELCKKMQKTDYNGFKVTLEDNYYFFSFTSSFKS
ncbi:hypothetical protein [Ureaplasma ceti]|uniref:Uncharacterized protein n=1 Tax=Ureaplasma ceti TaxID=3119530 RepID=A0ABP9UD10_9BACT